MTSGAQEHLALRSVLQHVGGPQVNATKDVVVEDEPNDAFKELQSK